MDPHRLQRNKQKIITIDVLATRKMREIRGLSRSDAGKLFDISKKQIEAIENGRVNIPDSRIELFIKKYGFVRDEYDSIKDDIESQNEQLKLTSTIQSSKYNCSLRNYQKIITKEVRVLQNLRKIKKLTQYQACEICGYHKSTIGHIENGRIEIPRPRIEHIVTRYGFKMDKFDELMKHEVLRDDVIEDCISKIESLDEQKLKAVQSLLANF